MLIYSIDNKESFENLSNWMETIAGDRLEGEGVEDHGKIITLVANKKDLYDESKKEEFVSEEEGKEFAEKNKCTFFMETSSKDNINIEELFDEVFNQAMKNYFESGKEKDVNYSEDEGGWGWCCFG